MKKSKYVILAAAIALWIVIFIFAESTLGKMLGLTTVEFWPALLGPSLIGFLGGDKAAEKKFFPMASFGIAMCLVFVLLEHSLIPILGASFGVLLALFIIMTVLICCQFFLPKIGGPVAFVYFTVATIQTHDILILTITRLVVLLLGTWIFHTVEHKIIGAVTGKKH